MAQWRRLVSPQGKRVVGTKGRSGGSRKRAGSPTRYIHLIDREVARQLNYLKLHRRGVLHDDEITADETVAWLIREKYDEVWRGDDEMNQRNVEIALEGEQSNHK